MRRWQGAVKGNKLGKRERYFVSEWTTCKLYTTMYTEPQM